MIIATRVLKLRRNDGDLEIPIRIFAPEQSELAPWICRHEIDWPDGKVERYAGGEDAVQALYLNLCMIGVEIYTSEEHESGKLEWTEPGQGYGFPMTNNVRDLMVGHDKDFF
jgi:hypothetical protein